MTIGVLSQIGSSDSGYKLAHVWTLEQTDRGECYTSIQGRAKRTIAVAPCPSGGAHTLMHKV